MRSVVCRNSHIPLQLIDTLLYITIESLNLILHPTKIKKISNAKLLFIVHLVDVVKIALFSCSVKLEFSQVLSSENKFKTNKNNYDWYRKRILGNL